jgi:hypothetical protein
MLRHRRSFKFKEDKTKDLQTLLAGQTLIHEATTSLAADPTIDDRLSRKLRAVSAVSQHRRHWEFAVAASGYMDTLGESAALTVPQIVGRIEQDPERAREYFGTVTTLPVDFVLSAGLEVAGIFGAEKVSLMDTISGSSFCYKKCFAKPRPEQAQCLTVCLRRVRKD